MFVSIFKTTVIMIVKNMTIIYKNLYLCLFLLIFNTFLVYSQSPNNTITQGQVIRDGDIIISQSQNYALGFFSPGNSSWRYVGIWYHKVPAQTVIWVANRENPISGKSGFLSFGNDGNLKLSVGNSSIVWSTNATSISINSTVILMDTGNLALCRSEDIEDSRKALWQSFGHPTDTFVPDMKVYTYSQTFEKAVFTSWKSPNDPSHGNYSLAFDPRASPQIVATEGSNRRLWRSGHWNGLIFLGVPNARARYISGFKINTERNGDIYFIYTSANSSQLVRFLIQWDGVTEQLIWDEGRQQWTLGLSQPSDDCGKYNKCGNFGVCSMENSQRCNCMKGFVPKFADQWHREDWSGGCVRRNPLKCDSNGTSDGFLQVDGVKLPDFADTLGTSNSGECEAKCIKNCSCSAYGFVVGIGCMIWSGDLVDVEHLDDGRETLYLRVADSELGRKKKISDVAVIVISVVGAIILLIIFFALWRLRKKWKGNGYSQNMSMLTDLSRSQEFSAGFSGASELAIEGKQGNGPQLPLFSFHYVELATDNFATKNKLGQGGFGPVYKGILPGGQEVAVKRLSKWSGQGLEEFKTEMILIAKLQHRNLVRLLGCCIEGEEKLLIYEYMPNKSLDSFLFDPTRKAQLDWNKRSTIIEGVARGLLYLHRDSRLRIIHRDLKASNILLDEEMNPKISDFGMARIFGGNQNEANTVRVVGTYGYMSPEYAMEGLFSVKSDVYSFGVLLLELVSGQRNTTFRSPECTNLIRYAWNLWKDGKSEELIDPVIAESCPRDIVMQWIHVGMLCVQISAGHRPTMSSVLLMLESEGTSLPMPRQPDITSTSSADMDVIMQDHDIISSTEVTVTEVTGR